MTYLPICMLGKWVLVFGKDTGSRVGKHRWFSGRIIAFQAVDPGSIPGRCIFVIPKLFIKNFPFYSTSISDNNNAYIVYNMSH